jgi:hypothetical protein
MQFDHGSVSLEHSHNRERSRRVCVTFLHTFGLLLRNREFRDLCSGRTSRPCTGITEQLRNHDSNANELRWSVERRSMTAPHEEYTGSCCMGALLFQCPGNGRTTVEARSGIGEQMNRTNKKQSPKKRGAVPSKKRAGSGTVRLNETAEHAVSTNRGMITESLLKSTLAGNVISAKLLIFLADGGVHGDDSGTGGLRVSVANAWMAEPEWGGETSEASAETGWGGREPES